jgi:Domain of unknown function (DUF4386)
VGGREPSGLGANFAMNTEDAASAFLILLPIAFNASFFLLARLFDYPDILRRPTEDILSRFQAGGIRLKLVWYGFMLTAILLAPLAILMGQVLARDSLAVVPTATIVGVLAAVVQFLGLARRPFLVPALARRYHDPASSQATRDATIVVFESFHRYLGVAIGECLGYLFTGAWTVLVGVAMLQSSGLRSVARTARDCDRPLPRRGLARVRRPLRREGLETRGRARPDRLRRLVALANRRRARASLWVKTCVISALRPNNESSCAFLPLLDPDESMEVGGHARQSKGARRGRPFGRPLFSA